MKSHFLAALLCMLLLPGCAVYRVDVQQGNEITAKMLTELKRGMSKREVSKVLGLPLINDPFHIDRWDYYFSFKKGRSGEVEQQFATLWFIDDALSDIESSLIDSLSDDLLDDDYLTTIHSAMIRLTMIHSAKIRLTTIHSAMIRLTMIHSAMIRRY